MLLDGGATVNVINAKCETPLHDAVARDNAPVVKLLLQRGADPSIKNKKGVDCHQLASEKNPKMVQILAQSRCYLLIALFF